MVEIKNINCKLSDTIKNMNEITTLKELDHEIYNLTEDIDLCDINEYVTINIETYLSLPGNNKEYNKILNAGIWMYLVGLTVNKKSLEIHKDTLKKDMRSKFKLEENNENLNFYLGSCFIDGTKDKYAKKN